MSNALSHKKLSPDKEFEILSTIINLEIYPLAKKFALNQVGYDNDEKIIELLIRTSLTVEELCSKLEYLGYNNIDQNTIQVSESGIVCVPLPIGRASEYTMVYVTLMSFNY